MDVRETIRANNERWNEAFNRGDAAAVAGLYAADATVLPHTHDVICGADAIRDFWQSVIGAGFRNHGIELIDVHARGDLAVETAKWRAEGPGEGGGRQEFGGSLVNVFERQADGSWKCRVPVWNCALAGPPARARTHTLDSSVIAGLDPAIRVAGLERRHPATPGCPGQARA